MSIQMVSSPAPEGLVQSASELRAGDYVVYPSQGVHRVVGLERMDIAGQQLEVVKLEREHDGAAVIVPVEKVPSTGLRRVAARELIEDVFHLLGAAGKEVELDWKERHREIVERLMAGGVLGVAEVVKELHALSQIRPPPPKEREQYDNARHLLVHEVAVSLAVPLALAEDYIDYALTPPAGVKLALKPPPKPPRKPKPPPWMPRRHAQRPPAAEEMEEELGLGEIAPKGGEPGEEGAAPAERGEEEIGGAAEREATAAALTRPARGKRAAKAERVEKARPKKPAPRKRIAKKAGLARRKVSKKRAKRKRKRKSRARR